MTCTTLMERTTNMSSAQSGLSRRQILSIGAAGLLMEGFAPMLAAAVRTRSRRIDAALAALDHEAIVKLTMDLADIPSPLGQEEQAARFLHGHMSETGLDAQLQSFAPGRSNVLATLKGTGGGRTLMLNGHLETSSSAEARSMPPARLDGGWIIGRGVWNMNGSLAAYVAAVSAVKKAGISLPGTVLIAATAGAWDEAPVDTRIKGEAHEGYGAGTKHMLAQGVTADFAVVGEPTSFKLAREHLGIVWARVDVAVKGAITDTVDIVDLTDTARREKALEVNSVEEVARIAEALRTWTTDYQRRNTVDGVIPLARITAIESGPPWKFFSAKSSLFLGVQTLPGAAGDVVLDEIRPILAEAQVRRPGLEAKAELYSVNPGPRVADGSPIVTALRAAHDDVFGRDPGVVVAPWYSDASVLNLHGIPAVNYGPAGRITREGEGVRVDDLLQCARVYIDLIVRVCA